MARDQYVHQLEAIEDRVESMAEFARGMLQDGVASLVALDPDLAKSVVDRTDELAQADEDIETAILHVLTLQAPMAKDLRRMGAALKLITYINRVGRYGYDIAKATRDWPADRQHVARMVGLRDMATKVEGMLAMVIRAYRGDQAPEIEGIMELEDDVDAMRHAVFREALTYMAEDPHHIEPCVHYMMVARYLERCGDNVVKMAEKLHYVATGQRLLLD